MAMRSDDTDGHRPIRDTIRRLTTAPSALSILWPVLLIVGGYISWHRWGAEHVAKNFYGVDPSLLNVTQAPPHVRTDLVETIYEDTQLEHLSTLDPQATAKIASAFSTHPWVDEVFSVRKLPDGVIDVQIQYRTPVAMVHVISQHHEVKDDAFFAVDGNGVLLPTSDFTPDETLKFLHIRIPGVYPTGRVGGPFGDHRVTAAARLAAILHPYREQLDLLSIDVQGDIRENSVPQLGLTTNSGTHPFWGSPPGMEANDEPPATVKIQALLEGGANSNADLRIAEPKNKPSSNQLAFYVYRTFMGSVLATRSIESVGESTETAGNTSKPAPRRYRFAS